MGSKSHENSPSTSSTGTMDSTPSFKPGAHGRNLSSATGVDVPNVADVLPMSDKQKKQEALARKFSRRGVRLAVHSSIMDANAHDIPTSLRKKWIHQAQLRGDENKFDVGSPSFAQLSRISEVNSNAGPEELRSVSTPKPGLATRENTDEILSPEKTISHTSSISDRLRERSSTLRNSPLGKQLGGLIKKLSRSGISERKAKNKAGSQAVEEQDPPPAYDDHGRDKSTWTYRLTKPFRMTEPTTPDYE